MTLQPLWYSSYCCSASAFTIETPALASSIFFTCSSISGLVLSLLAGDTLASCSRLNSAPEQSDLTGSILLWRAQFSDMNGISSDLRIYDHMRAWSLLSPALVVLRKGATVRGIIQDDTSSDSHRGTGKTEKEFEAVVHEK